MRNKRCHIAGVVTLLFPLVIFAQVIRPALSATDIRLGYQHKYFHRHMEYFSLDWSYGSPFIQCRLFKPAILSVEAAVYDFTDDRYDYDNEYRLLAVGAGILVDVYHFKGFRVALSGHYSEVLYLGKTSPNDHQLAQGFVGAIQVDKSVHLFRQELTFLLAPAYVWDRITNWPLGFEESSVKNIGIILGLDLLLLDRIELFAQAVYVEYIQPRFGLNVRL